MHEESLAREAHVGDSRCYGLNLRGADVGVPIDALVEGGAAGHFALTRVGFDLGCALTRLYMSFIRCEL